jgi:hypothetical protein
MAGSIIARMFIYIVLLSDEAGHRDGAAEKGRRKNGEEESWTLIFRDRMR